MCFEVADLGSARRGERVVVVGRLRGGAHGSLVWRQGQGGLEEVEEGCLTRGTGADDEDAKLSQVGCIFDELCQLDLLEWSWVLPSSDPPRTVDCADCAAGIAVTSTMGHAFSTSVWIHPVATTTPIRWNWRDWRVPSGSG